MLTTVLQQLLGMIELKERKYTGKVTQPMSKA